ncbi:MAG: sigma-54-dependent Fis family transcriptional regulator [Magnetococcales bacterium]|nr:sigma-54-dependent Fis family transcriptional regulator [Magnetococcales bacterium]MBF0116143.1 sigma-54-dependent Fis family transcriptional regulator [Magnetococcales bacterium]
MFKTSEIRQRLVTLKAQLDRITRAWSNRDYENLMRFFVAVFPPLVQAERCSIFIYSAESDNVWLKFGTGMREKEIIAPKDGSIVGRTIAEGTTIFGSNLEHHSGFHAQVDQKTDFVTRNLISIPIFSLAEKRCIGAVQVLNKRSADGFTQQDEILLQQVVRYLALSIEHNIITEEMISISKHMHEEMARSDFSASDRHRFIAESPSMRQTLEIVRQIGSLPVNVFITGESGTGKEVIARMIHEQSSERRSRPFVAVNCSAIPENLMESEFFGYEKGAFTGAVASRLGRFEEANGGTLFLDEISEMPLTIQPKFLRAIQEKEGVRLGGNRLHRYDFRIISASAKKLQDEVKKGRFREDLFFRLFAVDLTLPPLRERPLDILPLAMMFLDEVSTRFNKKVLGYSPEVLARFEGYGWPGNVRQLEHEVERLVALTPDNEIISAQYCSLPAQGHGQEQALQENLPDSFSLPTQRERLEIRLIRAALNKTQGNKLQAAQLLDITRQSLHNKLRQYGIED